MNEPTDHPELNSKERRCEACGEAAYEYLYGFWICNACKKFLYHCFKPKSIHKPCQRNQLCNLTLSTLMECSCCFLKKCVNLKMDPYYETRRKISRHAIPKIQDLRRSFPFHPCPTCTSNIFSVSEELNRKDYNTSSADSSQIISKDNMDNLTVPSLQRYQPCKVCGNNVKGPHYSVPACGACRSFFRSQVIFEKGHRPCVRKQQCIITSKRRSQCPCCRLKKCLAVGMDPAKLINNVVINYDRIVNYEPIDWIVLFSCKTCDVKKISNINESIQGLKCFFEIAKVNRYIPIAECCKVIKEDFVQSQFESDNENCLKPLDFVPKHFTPFSFGDSIDQTNLNHSGPTLFSRNDLGFISNNNLYSGLYGGRFPTLALSHGVGTVENHGAISFEEGLLVPSMEKSDVSSSRSHVEVISGHGLNLSSPFTLSSSPSPDVCKGINPVGLGISGESVTEEKNTDDLENIDMTAFRDLMLQNYITYYQN